MRCKEIRGKILAFLKYIYPENVDESGILAVYYQYYRKKDIKGSLEYLVDKGYVIRKTMTHPYKNSEEIHFYKISPDGIDLIDGLREDPGIIRVEW
jgi:hypothetical protein